MSQKAFLIGGPVHEKVIELPEVLAGMAHGWATFRTHDGDEYKRSENTVTIGSDTAIIFDYVEPDGR